jgi:hypothetical protein
MVGNMAVRTDVFRQVGGFRTDFGKRGSIPQPEDTDLCIRMAEATGGHWMYVPEAITHLWEGLCAAYRILGFESATKGDSVFRDLVLARIIEPTSKIDAERVLSEVGVEPASYATVKRRLRGYAQPGWRQSLATACAAHARLGPASLVLFDVSTLYFETDAGDGFREPGFSKERRLEPQITLGLLTDAAGFPLTVAAFEGNKAETATMVPVINAFKAAHHLADVTVVADAGMISEANQVDCKRRAYRSSWAPASRICLMWCVIGMTNTQVRRFPMGWC